MSALQSVGIHIDVLLDFQGELVPVYRQLPYEDTENFPLALSRSQKLNFRTIV